MSKGMVVLLSLLSSGFTALVLRLDFLMKNPLTKTKGQLMVVIFSSLFLLLCGYGLILYADEITAWLKSIQTEVKTKLRRRKVVPRLIFITVFFLCLGLASAAMYTFEVGPWKKTEPPPVEEPEPDVEPQIDSPIVAVPSRSNVELQVVVPKGKKLKDFVILLESSSRQDEYGLSAVADPVGKVKFEDVPHGNYDLIAICSPSNSELQIARRPLDHNGGGVEQWAIVTKRVPVAVFDMDKFPREDWTLQPSHLDTFGQFVSEVRKPNRKALVLGFSDSEGPSSYNDKLSGMRAGNLISRAVSLNYSKRIFHPFALGERMPAVANIKGGTSKNRRVQCIVFKDTVLAMRE